VATFVIPDPNNDRAAHPAVRWGIELMPKSRKVYQLHGGSYTPEYRAWVRMIQRCENSNGPEFPGYGGRGIRVCARWRDSFEAFREDMGPKPSAGHSLDRFPDQNGDYEPGNCRWATNKQQSRNTRSNRLLTFNGETHCLAEWAAVTGVNSMALRSRLRKGWAVERALTTPVKPYKPRQKHRK
jgi:hypothetical protein